MTNEGEKHNFKSIEEQMMIDATKENAFQILQERLKIFLETNNLTCGDVAKSAGVSERTVYAVLSGETPDPRISTFFAIAKAIYFPVKFPEK